MEHNGVCQTYANTGFNSQGTGRFRDRVATSFSPKASSSAGLLLVFGL